MRHQTCAGPSAAAWSSSGLGQTWREPWVRSKRAMSGAAPQHNRLARLCTGVQHASTLVLVLGSFVGLAAVNTDPYPATVVHLGIFVIGIGVVGFIAGWLGRWLVGSRSAG